MVNTPLSEIRIPKIIFRLVGSFFTGLCIGFVLVIIIGYLIDIISYPGMKKIGNRALQDLRKITISPDRNAWDFYGPALDKIGDREPSPALIRYAVGETLLTETINDEITAAQDIYELIEKGNRQPGCVVPLDYSQGWKMIQPDYDRVVGISQLISARSFLHLDRGEMDGSLRSIYLGLAFIRNLTYGTPQLINYSQGIALLQKQLRPLRVGLRAGRFRPGQLASISAYLDDLEVGFPTLRWVIEGEINIRKVGFSNLPLFMPVEFGSPRVIKGTLVEKIGYSVWMRFLLWRYCFSSRFGIIMALKFWDQIIDELEKMELNYLNKTWPQDKDSLVMVNLRLFRYSRQNPIFLATVPPLSGFFRTKTEMLTRIRLLNLATRLWSYRNEHGRFPLSLSEIDHYSTIEPFTGVAWHYDWSPDSVVITSPGYNEIYGDVNDLTLTLKKTSD